MGGDDVEVVRLDAHARVRLGQVVDTRRGEVVGGPRFAERNGDEHLQVLHVRVPVGAPAAVLPVVSELFLCGTRKIVLNNRSFSICTGTSVLQALRAHSSI